MASATQEKQPAPEPTAAQAASTDLAASSTLVDGTVPKKEEGAAAEPPAAASNNPASSPTGTRKSKKTTSPANSPPSTLTKANPSASGANARSGSAGQQQQPSSPPNGTANSGQAPKKPRRSFWLWKGFRNLLLPCIPSLDGHKAHDIDVGTGASSKTAASGTKEVAGEDKLNEKAGVDAGQADAAAASTPHAKSSSAGTAKTSDTVPVTPTKTKPSLTVPVTPIENDGDAMVVIPPSPHSHLLPRDETEGVTSGAVQPPGGTGVDVSITDDNEGDVADHEGGHGLGGDMDAEDEDDEEERLILAGGTGIPIGPDGKPCPLLPPLAAAHKGRKCLVLDLDETLLHSSFKLIPQADYVVPVEIEWQWHNVYVIKRPGVDNFLKQMGELYEVVIFTASLSKYADPVLDKLDVHKVVAHRLFRESCYNHKGSYVKDLSRLGRPVEDMIILDNSPASYIFHPNNAVPVSSWFNDPHDTELTDLCPFLGDLMHVEDVRGVLDGGL